MDAKAVAAVLRSTLANKGWSVANDPGQIESVLRSQSPATADEITALAAASRAGVPAFLMQLAPGSLNASAVNARVNTMGTDFGLSPELARWSVVAWAMALGVLPVPSGSGPGGPGAANATAERTQAAIPKRQSGTAGGIDYRRFLRTGLLVVSCTVAGALFLNYVTGLGPIERPESNSGVAGVANEGSTGSAQAPASSTSARAPVAPPGHEVNVEDVNSKGRGVSEGDAAGGPASAATASAASGGGAGVAGGAEASKNVVATDPSGGPAGNSLQRRCDELADSPYDPQKIGAGVPFDKIQITQALAACQAAASVEPVAPHYLYTYGRTLHAARRYKEAFEQYSRAAAAGYTYAMVNIGLLYDKDGGLPTNYEEAAAWYRKAADAGNALAMLNLGRIYDEGRGTSRNAAEAAAWYRKAADAGNALAMFNLGRIYDEGRGTSRNSAEAVAWYHKAADAGNAGAMFNLGGMYDTGDGVPENHAEANAWYRKAADAGLVDGMFNLASNYHHGVGVPQDDTEAIAWYRKAVAVGDPRSACNLGLMYVVGAGVPRSGADAAVYFRKAAESGIGMGMANLGVLYEFGDGVPENRSTAIAWYRKAIAAGFKPAQRLLQDALNPPLGASYSSGAPDSFQQQQQDERERAFWFGLDSAGHAKWAP